MGGAAAVAGAVAAPRVLAQSAPVNIRYGFFLPPTSQMAGVFTLKPELLKHHGKTYTFEAKNVRSTSTFVTALAAGEVDIGNIGFSSFPLAVLNAGLTDLKIIGDEAEDGLNGMYASETRVRKDSGIKTINDLKGKVIAVTALGGAADLLTRYTLRKYGLELNRDYTYVETPFPTMKAMLLEKKVDASYFAQPFASDPEVLEKTNRLFTSEDVMGPMMANFIAARGGFIAKNRAAMVDFMEDFIRVVRWYYDPANRDEAIKVVSEQSKMPEAVLRRYIFTKEDNFRSLDALPELKPIQNNWKAMRDFNLLKQDMNVEDHADLSIAKEAAARLAK